MGSPPEHAPSSRNAADVLPIGSWLRGKYHIERVIGAGGMATVYAATHRNKKRVAIKVLRSELASVEMVRRFVREGYVANTVEHPGVVSVTDDDVSESGHPFLVMELLQGESVEAAANRRGGCLDADEVLCIAHQVLDVLVSAHGRNVVHRDIKPANLFVTSTGQVKVLDFGIARLREEHASPSETSTGRALGTPAFMAPEQARGKSSQIGPHTDIWSVGAAMFTLLSGKSLHVGETVQELVFNTATTPPPSLAAVLPNAHPELIALVDMALAFEPANRWPSAAAMRDAVARAHESIFGRSVGNDALARLIAGRVVVPPSDRSLAPDVAGSRAVTIPSSPDGISPATTALGQTTTQQPLVGATTRERRSTATLILALAALFAVGGAATMAVSKLRAKRDDAAVPTAAAVSTAAASATSTATAAATTSSLPVPTASVVASATSATAPAASEAPRATTKAPAPKPKAPKTPTPAKTADWDRQ